MVIEITQEMIHDFARAWHEINSLPEYKRFPGDRRKAGLQKVIEIIERDYRVEKK